MDPGSAPNETYASHAMVHSCVNDVTHEHGLHAYHPRAHPPVHETHAIIDLKEKESAQRQRQMALRERVGGQRRTSAVRPKQ